METSVARREHLHIVGDATRRREVQCQLHTKMGIISSVQTCSNLRYPTRSSLMHICTVSVGVPILNEHMQAANGHSVHRFSSPLLISYIVVMTSPSSRILKSACVIWQGTIKSSCSHSLLPTAALSPHLLKVLDDHHVGVHVAVDAVLHASILASSEGALRQAASDALLEADGVELVDGCRRMSVCEGIEDMHAPVL